MHLQPVYQHWTATLNGSADRLFSNGLTLPSGSGMTDEQFGLVDSAIKEMTDVRGRLRPSEACNRLLWPPQFCLSPSRSRL